VERHECKGYRVLMADTANPDPNLEWSTFLGEILAHGNDDNNERKQERSKRREREIQRAALRIFARDGISKSRIQDIAAEAGMPVSTLYEYCSSKEELAYIVPMASISQFYEEFAAAAAAEPTAGGKLRLYLTLAADFARRNPDWARVLYLEIWPSVLITESPLRRYLDDYVRIIVFLIRFGAKLGEWTAEENPYELAAILNGSVNQIIITALLYRRPHNLARAAESILDRTMSLFRAPAGKKKAKATRSKRR
jgi:AcrR family transcriptional regulator